MYSPRAYANEYRRQQIEGASQGEMVWLLLDGVVRFLHTARLLMEQKDIPGTHNALVRARDIVYELQGSLDFEGGGDIAKNLNCLYAFAIRRITEANSSKDPAGIDDASAVITDLRNGWRQMLDSPKQDIPAVEQQPEAANVPASTSVLPRKPLPRTTPYPSTGADGAPAKRLSVRG